MTTSIRMGRPFRTWSFTWDSTPLTMARIDQCSIANTSGVTSDVLKRTYEVDNLPAAPNFAFSGPWVFTTGVCR